MINNTNFTRIEIELIQLLIQGQLMDIQKTIERNHDNNQFNEAAIHKMQEILEAGSAILLKMAACTGVFAPLRSGPPTKEVREKYLNQK